MGYRSKDRPHMQTILLSEEEREALRALAKRAGVDVSTYVRQWLRREARTKLGLEIVS